MGNLLERLKCQEYIEASKNFRDLREYFETELGKTGLFYAHVSEKSHDKNFYLNRNEIYYIDFQKLMEKYKKNQSMGNICLTDSNVLLIDFYERLGEVDTKQVQEIFVYRTTKRGNTCEEVAPSKLTKEKLVSDMYMYSLWIDMNYLFESYEDARKVLENK